MCSQTSVQLHPVGPVDGDDMIWLPPNCAFLYPELYTLFKPKKGQKRQFRFCFTPNFTRTIGANLVTAAILISFGAVYGFVSPTQLILVAIIEPFLMLLNEHIIVYNLHVSKQKLYTSPPPTYLRHQTNSGPQNCHAIQIQLPCHWNFFIILRIKLILINFLL